MNSRWGNSSMMICAHACLLNRKILLPSLVCQYASTHSILTFSNVDVNWCIQGHLKDICFHGLVCS